MKLEMDVDEWLFVCLAVAVIAMSYFVTSCKTLKDTMGTRKPAAESPAKP